MLSVRIPFCFGSHWYDLSISKRNGSYLKMLDTGNEGQNIHMGQNIHFDLEADLDKIIDCAIHT